MNKHELIDLQIDIEQKFAHKHVDAKIREAFEPWETAQEVIDEITDAVLDEWTEDPSRVAEAGASLADAEYRAIDLAHATRDAALLFAVRDAAVRRAMRSDAKKEAIRRLDRMARERQR